MNVVTIWLVTMVTHCLGEKRLAWIIPHFNTTSPPLDIPDFSSITYDDALTLDFYGTFEPTITWIINNSESSGYSWAATNTLSNWDGDSSIYSLNFTFAVGDGPFEIYANVTLDAVSGWSYSTNSVMVYYRGVENDVTSATVYDSDFPYTITCSAYGEDADIVSFVWFAGT